MKLNESIMKNLKESEGRTYSVVIGFAGFIGVEEEYNVYAMNRGDAVCEALDNPGSEAEMDLAAESVEDLGDGNYEVVVSFAGNIGAENNYTVYAESEEEAEMYAIEEAKADLEVLSVDGTEFSYDETFECAKVKKDKNKLEEDTGTVEGHNKYIDDMSAFWQDTYWNELTEKLNQISSELKNIRKDILAKSKSSSNSDTVSIKYIVQDMSSAASKVNSVINSITNNTSEDWASKKIGGSDNE